jgi:glycosyltransferase involved in cell wall biosynthesis
MPNVSVIIPTHNRAAYLKAAIASVLNQTFQDFEILIVDDGSSDTTPDVVKSFDDDRIQYVRHPKSRGGAAARNTGIGHCRGEYVAFLDDDDEWFADKLARQMVLLLASPPEVGCIYTGYVCVDRVSGKEIAQKIPTNRGDLSKELLTANCLGGTSSVLLKRACFKQVGVFDQNLPSFQDHDLWIRISKSFHFDYIGEPLLRYYVHRKQIWSDLEAVNRGMDLMLEKYGDSRSFRKFLSYQYLSLGVSYCYKRNLKAGRRAYLQAMQLYPYEVRHYFNLCLTLLGPAGFANLKHAKTAVSCRL